MRLLRMRVSLAGWAREELLAGRYRRAFSLLRASITGDLT